MTVLECNHSLHDQVQAGADHCPLCQADTIEQLRKDCHELAYALHGLIYATRQTTHPITHKECRADMEDVGKHLERAANIADSILLGRVSADLTSCPRCGCKALAEGGG